MTRPIAEITAELMTDNRPSTDGCSNADRIAYICEVLDCESIDLNRVYDFGQIVACKDDNLVEAGRQIATLQLEYLRRLHDHGYVDRDDFEVKTATLILDIQRISWHHQHLSEGRVTPPFRFIH